MTTIELLAYELKICLIHLDRLKLALKKTEHLYPFTENIISNIPEEDLGYLELLTARLGKLQDTLGEKVFTLILKALGEPMENKSFIDKLNKLEKLEILPSVQWWQDLRKLRNILVHEYPDNPAFIADNLNTAFIQTKRLLVFWDSLITYIEVNHLTS
jgi:hypothetical protein